MLSPDILIFWKTIKDNKLPVINWYSSNFIACVAFKNLSSLKLFSWLLENRRIRSRIFVKRVFFYFLKSWQRRTVNLVSLFSETPFELYLISRFPATLLLGGFVFHSFSDKYLTVWKFWHKNEFVNRIWLPLLILLEISVFPFAICSNYILSNDQIV